MPENKSDRRDIVIIGGGHNGLVTAFYLAKAGFKPLVLERRTQVGGAAVTDEFHPGFRCSTLAHSAGPIRPDIARDMQLEKHGLRFITPETCVTALSPDGRALSLYQDQNKSAQSIAAFSQKDATKYAEFAKSLSQISKVIAEALATTPPDIDHPSSGDLWSMLKTGRAIAQPRQAGYLPRPALGTDGRSRSGGGVFRDGVVARGDRGSRNLRNISGPVVGRQQPATTDSRRGRFSSRRLCVFCGGGMGSLTQAMASAAKAAGVEIRTEAEVIEIRIKDGAATGVLLGTGEEISANAVISNADPKRTLLKLTDSTHLSPDFVQKLQHFRGNGTVAKVNLALSGLPSFTALKNGERRSAQGAHPHWTRDRLSGARFRRIEIRKLLAPALSRSYDPFAH